MDMLFGHLASRFSPSRENLATEALAFILNRSPAMRETFRRLVRQTGIDVPELTRFRSQAADKEGNIPDLIGSDAKGAEPLVVENKFWAGLTENQPVGYLDKLAGKDGAVLLFIVPRKRLPMIWTDLSNSARNQQRNLPDPETSADLLFARINSTVLAVTTWNAILDSLETAARASGEIPSAGDIAQLRSLCDAMDNEAFLPVRTEELTNLEIPRRMIGLADLIPELAQKAVELGIAVRGTFLPAHGWYRAGRYLGMGPGRYESWMGIDYACWSRYGISPLWIRFTTRSGGARLVLEALKGWHDVFEAANGEAFVALKVLPNVARERVLEDLLEQLKKLNDALKSVPPLRPAAGDTVETDTDEADTAETDPSTNNAVSDHDPIETNRD